VEITDIEKRLAEIERRVAGDGKSVCGAPFAQRQQRIVEIHF
jgi:hypothetical protein